MTIWDKKFNEVESIKQPKIIKYPYVLADVFNQIEDSSGNVLLLSTGSYVGFTTIEKAGVNLCEGEIVAIPWGGSPNVKYYSGKFVTADNRIATSNNLSILTNKHIALWLQSNIKLLESLYRGASIKHPSMNDVLNLNISFPSINEQEKISNVLFKVENLITLHQREYYFYTRFANDLITRSTSLFSNSLIICKYTFCVVVIVECPNLFATLAIDTPANNNNDA